MMSQAGSEPTPIRRRRTRNSLSNDEIVTAALKLTESEGLAGLSMPVLARKLGCATMSIYKYFPSKDVLLDELAHRVMQTLHRRLPPAGNGHWRDEILAYFTAYREMLEESAAYREIVLYAPASAVRTALTAAQLKRLDTGIGLLHSAGLALDDAVRIYNVYYNFTRAYVAYEHAVQVATSDRSVKSPASHPTFDPSEYPLLAAVQDPLAAIGVDGRGFRLGLELLTSGVSRTFGIPLEPGDAPDG